MSTITTMPIDYSKYPNDWKTRIRPDILKRAKDRCEFCLVENKAGVFRGILDGVAVYQKWDGSVYDAKDGSMILIDREGAYAYIESSTGDPNQVAIKVVLTIAHLDHDVNNNCYSNLAALCQRCHNRHDAKYRAANRKAKRQANQTSLFTI